MTAFNNTQPDHSSHKIEADEEEAPASHLSQPCSPSSWDSGISLLDAQKKFHFCERSCNEEACRSVEGKHISSGSPVVCCLCSEKLPDVLMSKQEVMCLLNRELEQERIAAESSANEAISMILRLQVEKAALQMEARHYQQVLEAKTLYDEETISQLQAIITSQEADRLVLEQEIEECREALRMYSEIVTEEGGSECEEFGKGCVMASTAPTFIKKTLCRMPSRGSGGSLRPLSLEEKFNHVAMQTMEDAQQLEWPSLDTKDEAKTKYVVSMSTSDPTLIVDPGNSALEARAMTHGAYLRMQDRQNGSMELEGVKVGTQGKCLDDVVKDCWLSILMQLSKLYKQILRIETLGISSFEGDCRLTNCQGCSFDSRNGISQMQQKFPVDCAEYVKWDSCAPDACQKEGYILSPKLAHQNLECKLEMLPSMLHFYWNNNNCNPLHQQGKVGNSQVCAPMNSWCHMMAITDGCIMNLAEKFATCQSRFHALEATRRAMKEALEITKENKWKADKVLMIAADMMRDFLSFIGLGFDILDLLHNLMTHLTMILKVVEDMECAETDLSSKLNTPVIKQDNTLAADGKEPETVFSLIQHSPREMDWKMSKLASWWSSSFEWLSNEKSRAETAFSGWDHI